MADVKFRDTTIALPEDLLSEIKLNDQIIDLQVNVPESFFKTLLDECLERGYLNNTSDRKFIPEKLGEQKIQWLQITRLPIHPNENEDYDILSRWQGVLSSLHSWNYRLIFLLLRNKGITRLYLGAMSIEQGFNNEEAIQQVKEAAFGSMPGMEMRILNYANHKEGLKSDVADEIILPMFDMECVGAVTGIPSFAASDSKAAMQTLDQLAFGIRDGNNNEKDYAMIVVADPIPDREISEIISSYRTLGSQIHSFVSQNASQSLTRGESKEKQGKSKAIGGLIGSALGGLVGGCMTAGTASALMGVSLGANIGGQLGLGIASGFAGSAQIQASGSASKSVEYLDKFAQYAEQVTDHHIDRLNDGRNLGFWNTGIYILGKTNCDVKAVAGILRSIYSGKETYYEPIRLHLLSGNSGAKEIVKKFEMVRLPSVELETLADGRVKLDPDKLTLDDWHILGRRYQYLSTPINTTELALATSLPRRDVPGLRFVKTAVRFANNPAPVTGDKIVLGNIVDIGVVQNSKYEIDVHSLVRHALVAGSTGSGKSTTCKRILNEVLHNDIPVMVIEPAKDDYVRWAIEMNRTLPDDKKFKIFMPGADSLDGEELQQLYINPFQPAAIDGAKVDLLQHSENFATLLNACLPSEEVVPILIEEVVYETIRDYSMRLGRDFDNGSVQPLREYPPVSMMLDYAEKVMDRKTYEQRNRDNLKEVLITRFRSLSRGMRGKILNVSRSTSFDMLFSSNVVINLSRLAGSKNKSLVMSLLMQALYEYRQSRYADDSEYRRLARMNRLCHLTLVEEAHNVLLKPLDGQSSGSPQRAAAELFDNMLSEIRSYAEGFIVVDQVPTNLIDGAIKNTNYKIVHRLTAPDDQQIMASCMALRDDQKYIIPALEKGHAVICGDEDDAAVWVKIPAPDHI